MDPWLCKDPSEVWRIMYNKFPTAFMVLGIVSNEGHVMPPHLFFQRLQVNFAAYIDVLQIVITPWIASVWNRRPYIFQQDSSTLGSINIGMDDWKFLWPSNS